MAALFQLSGSIKSCSHKQTSWWRNGNEVPLRRPPPRMNQSNIFQIPPKKHRGCFRHVTGMLLGLGLLFGGRCSCRCRFCGRFGSRRGSQGTVQTQAPATECKNTQKKNVILITGVILRETSKNVIYNGEFTYMFFIFFTKALTALTILLIRTCHQNNM